MSSTVEPATAAQHACKCDVTSSARNSLCVACAALAASGPAFFMNLALAKSVESVDAGGGPFGACITDAQGNVVSVARNAVTQKHDPTAHAEVEAIREAASKLETHDLSGCVLYTSCEPCPMCLAATYWAGIKTVYFCNTRKDAAAIDFDDDFIYQEIAKPIDQRSIAMLHMKTDQAMVAFRKWSAKVDKVEY